MLYRTKRILPRIRILTVNDRIALVTSGIGPVASEMVAEWLQPQWNTDDARGLENENGRSNGNDKFNPIWDISLITQLDTSLTRKYNFSEVIFL